MESFARKLAIESWILYAIGVFLIISRMTSRRLQKGAFTGYQLDDWLMIVVVVTFTAVIFTANQVASNYSPPGATELLTPEEIITAVYGSKMTMALEEFSLSTIWLSKACLLILYTRLTLGLRRHLAVKVLGVYCLIGFVVIQGLYLGYWCRPIQQYWLFPVKDGQCATYQSHMIVTTVFNISSDLIMLFIQLPLLISSKVSLRSKLLLCGVFSMGIFVIVAAVLNRYFNFTEAFSPISINWYVGEVSTAVYVANIPLCWPLVRRMFALDAFFESEGTTEEVSPEPSILTSTSKRSSTKASTTVKMPRSSIGQESMVGFDIGEEIGTADWGGPILDWPSGICIVSRIAKFETCIAGGRDLEEEQAIWQAENILKTVQIEQYSSQS